MPNLTLRVSSLSGWNDCPRRSFARSFPDLLTAAGYELRSPVRGIAAAVGTGVHAGAAHTMREKLESRVPLFADVEEKALVSFRDEIVDGVETDATSPNTNTAEGQVRAITGAFYHLVAPEVTPVAVEQRLAGNITDTVVLSGQPDFVTAREVHDLKTGRSAETYHAQLGGYGMLTEAAGGERHETAVIDHLPRVSASKPYPGPKRYEYDAALCAAEARSVVREILRSVAMFEQVPDVVVLPCNTSSNLCSPKYCTAYATGACPVSKTFTE